jgi:hypothetical protein
VHLQFADTGEQWLSTGMGNQLQTIQERFDKFHAAHPDVYDMLVQYARMIKTKGFDNFGIAAIWERLRWFYYIEQNAGEKFKMSNDYRSRYARLIMQQEPDLRNFFKLRELTAA